MTSKKLRADECLVSLGHAPNKSKAAAWILAGLVEKVDILTQASSIVSKAGEGVDLGRHTLRLKSGAFQKDVVACFEVETCL